MSIQYRDLEKLDALSIGSLSEDEWQDVHRQNAAMLLSSSNEIVHCHIAEDGHKIVGYVYGFVLPNGTLIPEFLYVLPDYRKLGVGTALMQMLEEKSGCSVSQIYYNFALHDYYKRQGYDSGDGLEVALKDLSTTK